MKHFFFKIFLWFWLGMVVMTIALLSSAALIRSRSADEERWRYKYELPLELRAHREADLVGRGATQAAASYVESFENRESIKNFMLDDAGHEVLGRQVPAKILAILPQLSQTAPDAPVSFYQQRLMAEKVVGPSAQRYTFFMLFPPRPLLPHSTVQFFLDDLGSEGIFRVLALLATAAIFCFWLARHITGPIGKLRLAARRIASRDLDARVGGEVIGRHDELAELGLDFNRMAERISALVNSQRSLLADVSHELRSPLTRLNLALGLARQRATPETAEHLNRIERETERLNHLIGQLLSLSRIESGVDLQQTQAFNLGALVQEVASDGDYEARIRKCAVKFDQRADCAVTGAPEMLRGGIENVIRNAVRHTAEGTTVEVILDLVANGGASYGVIEVRDHGSGVPEEELANLFAPFHRIPDGIRRDPNGAGLGLAIAERVFRLHGGNVIAKNAAGGGLTVTMQLPARPLRQPGIEDAPLDQPATATAKT